MWFEWLKLLFDGQEEAQPPLINPLPPVSLITILL